MSYKPKFAIYVAHCVPPYVALKHSDETRPVDLTGVRSPYCGEAKARALKAILEAGWEPSPTQFPERINDLHL